jgi:hypothetical protein
MLKPVVSGIARSRNGGHKHFSPQSPATAARRAESARFYSFLSSRLRARSRILFSFAVKLPIPDLEILSKIGSTEA